MPSTEEVLEELGPSLTSAVTTALVERFGMSSEAARKQVSRRSEPIRAVDLPFRRGARFLYLPQQYQSSEFYRSLSDACAANGGAYARTLDALGARGGILPLRHLAAAAGIGPGKGQLDVEDVVKRLVEANVLSELDVPGQGMCIGLGRASDLESAIPRMKARLVAEGILLTAIFDWARKLGLGSFNSFRSRDDGEVPLAVGRFHWDLSAPTYLSGLIRRDSAARPAPGFLLVDVLLHAGWVSERAISPFLYKSDTLSSMKMQRTLTLFVADGYEEAALNQLRKRGLVPATVETLFGSEVAASLQRLIEILSQTAASAVHPEQFEHLFQALGRFEGESGELRGALFEFVAAALLREEGWQGIILNKVYREGGKDLAEVDVRCRMGDDLLFVECKGIRPGSVLADSEVQAWLTKRIPAVERQTRTNSEFSNCKLRFELWVTGALSTEAIAMIEAHKAKVRQTKHTVHVRYGLELQERAKRFRTSQPSIFDVMQRHYVNSPLAESLAITTERRPKPKKTSLLDGFIDVSDQADLRREAASLVMPVLRLPAPCDVPPGDPAP